MTPGSRDMVDIIVVTDKGSKMKFTINKYKSFKVLIALIRFKNFEKMASRKGQRVDEFIKQTKEKGDILKVKFHYGEELLLENAQIKTIGNGAVIKQTIQYVGG